MSERSALLQESISDVRNKIVTHPLYQSIQTPEQLRVFTQHHVFAVWDFMSLLKGLQRGLTCVSSPWVPVGNANTRFLINEIVVGEESDVDEQGNRCSHYELYLSAMEQMKADTTGISALIQEISNGADIQETLSSAPFPTSVRKFLQFTFDTIESGNLHEMASVFTFGREDLIPDMFMEMVRDLDQRFPGNFDQFKYYLERHIEVDGGHHGQLALQMVEELCGDDDRKWAEATAAAQKALEMRKVLWDVVMEEIA